MHIPTYIPAYIVTMLEIFNAFYFKPTKMYYYFHIPKNNNSVDIML